MTHLSSCSVHNLPAYPAGPCNCGEWAREIVENLRGDDDELLPFVTLRVVENALIAAEKRGRIEGLRMAAEINGNDPDFPYKAMCRIMACITELEKATGN